MEQKAPKLASAGQIIGTLAILTSIVNVKLNLFDNAGISFEEFLGFGIGLICYITAFFAARERKVVELNKNLTLQEQFELLETTPTKSSMSSSNSKSQSTHTRSIINSIIGEQKSVNEPVITKAIGTLSSGDFGENAKSIAQQLPAPHRHASDISEHSAKNPSPDKSMVDVNVPLPTSKDTEKIFAAEESSITNLPITSQNADLPKNETYTELPDLSELFFDEANSSEQQKNLENRQNFDTPDLPDLDDLF